MYWLSLSHNSTICTPYVKACVEPIQNLFGWANNRRMAHQCTTDSPEQHSLGFSFSYIGCPIKAKEISLLYNLLKTGRIRDEFILFLKTLAQSEKKKNSSRIWTLISVSIYCNDNHYNKCALMLLWLSDILLLVEDDVIIYSQYSYKYVDKTAG